MNWRHDLFDKFINGAGYTIGASVIVALFYGTAWYSRVNYDVEHLKARDARFERILTDVQSDLKEILRNIKPRGTAFTIE